MSAVQDERPISTASALSIIARAMRYSLRYKYELAVKATTQMTSIFWILFLPWPGKIVIDYVVLGDTTPESDAINSTIHFFPAAASATGSSPSPGSGLR